MTHSPPIPAGNTSPYPLQEPPHVHAEPSRVVATEEDAGSERRDTATLLGLGAAVVLGVGATVAALWFAGRKPAAPVKRGKQKARRTKKA